jgi:hypothetical protein
MMRKLGQLADGLYLVEYYGKTCFWIDTTGQVKDMEQWRFAFGIYKKYVTVR